MSRVGKSPVIIPNGVTITPKEGVVEVAGPKGILRNVLPQGFSLETKDGILQIRINPQGHSHIHGLLRTLIYNSIVGVTKGWEKTLELVGVGYRATGSATELILQVGFSHPVKIAAPQDVTFQVKDNTQVVISGIDKKVVGEIAARIRSLKPPEPYKGKGIRYLGEIVRKKAGKVVKAAGAAA